MRVSDLAAQDYDRSLAEADAVGGAIFGNLAVVRLLARDLEVELLLYIVGFRRQHSPHSPSTTKSSHLYIFTPAHSAFINLHHILVRNRSSWIL